MSEKTAEEVLKKARMNDEPVFVLRAQDKAALAAYGIKCTMLDCSIKHLNEIKEIIFDFENFRNDNPERMKKPD